MTARDEQREQRRQLIIMKALDLFVRKGYSETKISDIAEAAGMSVGLLFHYFESKEQLYEQLVRMGADGTQTPQKMESASPLEYFSGFLKVLFEYSKQQPWVMQMFVLMGQASRSAATPPHIREIALGVSQIEHSAQIIAEGQRQGVFRDGDPAELSSAFWCSVQGVMEQAAAFPESPLPDPEWLLDIIRK